MRGTPVSEAEKIEDYPRQIDLDVWSTIASGTAKAYWGLQEEDRLALSPDIDRNNPRKGFGSIWLLFAISSELHDAAKRFVEQLLQERLRDAKASKNASPA